jgi:hypothetical protein
MEAERASELGQSIHIGGRTVKMKHRSVTALFMMGGDTLIVVPEPHRCKVEVMFVTTSKQGRLVLGCIIPMGYQRYSESKPLTQC